MDILIGTALGVLIAFLLSIPAIILDTARRVTNLPLLIDVHAWRGRKLTEGEIFAIGLLLQLIIGGLYGLTYTLFAGQGWLLITYLPYTILSMLIFAFLCWIVLGALVLPLIGLGFFGRKEGNTVWFETLISLMFEGVILWMLIQYYEPFYFLGG
ncbi:MAG: hypothetical protein Q8P30_04950 [Candidatus Uhrbacteria bacterium]|nr:hypothetical protein [Candidatus Uhrbacteria bacterium]